MKDLCRIMEKYILSDDNQYRIKDVAGVMNVVKTIITVHKCWEGTMIDYDVEAIADELMLTTEELKEIFSVYFEDASILLIACQAAIGRGDFDGVSKTMHTLKGSSLNLRMHNMSTLAADLEDFGKKAEETEFSPYLLKIQSEVDATKAHITAFYASMYKT